MGDLKPYGRLRRFALLLPLNLLLIAGVARAAPTAETDPGFEARQRLTQINASLNRWLELSDLDVPFLVIDEDAQQVRLYHQTALLRICEARFTDATAAVIASREPSHTRTLAIQAHLRTLRPASPYNRPDAGPFDWERYLADAATDRSALLLTNEMLIHASDTWNPAHRAVRLNPAGLRALFDALTDGTAVVFLPPGWATGDQP